MDQMKYTNDNVLQKVGVCQNSLILKKITKP